MTTVYLIRHSKAQRIDIPCDDFQKETENCHLLDEGKEIANSKFSNEVFADLDVLYSSNYARALETAKILGDKYHLENNVDSNLGERRYGLGPGESMPEGFERRQLFDENYKLPDGESQAEVKKRMYDTLMRIIRENENKNIAIVSHGTAISYLLMIWCDVDIINDKFNYSYKGKTLLNNFFNYCETFKLEFNGDELVNIEHIEL